MSCTSSSGDKYLFKHSLGIGNSGRLLPPPVDAGQVLAAGGQLVHGHHGVGRLLPAQLQHREEVQRGRAHVGQASNLGKFLGVVKMQNEAFICGK